MIISVITILLLLNLNLLNSATNDNEPLCSSKSIYTPTSKSTVRDKLFHINNIRRESIPGYDLHVEDIASLINDNNHQYIDTLLTLTVDKSNSSEPLINSDILDIHFALKRVFRNYKPIVYVVNPIYNIDADDIEIYPRIVEDVLAKRNITGRSLKVYMRTYFYEELDEKVLGKAKIIPYVEGLYLL